MDKTLWPLEPFNDAVDSQNLQKEWEEWRRAFNLLLELRNVSTQHEQLVLLLTLGGRGLQRIYYNLGAVPSEIYPEPVKVPYHPVEIPEYDNAIKRLDSFFVGKRNDRVELELFRSLKQSNDEPFNQFILKLRVQAARCDFKDRDEKEILQQITMGARDEKVRDKGLENVMGLNELTNYAINREVLVKQKEKTKAFRDDDVRNVVATVKQDWNKGPSSRGMNSYFPKREFRRNGSEGNSSRSFDGRYRSKCNRCGSSNHDGDARNCSARNARCNRCAKIGHYARVCNASRTPPPRNRYVWKRSDGRSVEETNSLQENEWQEDLPRRPESDDLSKVK